MFDTNKLMNTMIQKIDNVSYDLLSGATAIKTDGGLITVTSDGTINQNVIPFEFELPAFAMLTPADQVNNGDILVVNGNPQGFVTAVVGDLIEVIDINGQKTEYNARSVQFLGANKGFYIVKSLFNFTGGNNGVAAGGINPMMLMFMMGKDGGSGKKSMKDMLPLMLLSGGMGGGADANNLFSNPLMLMMLMGDDANPFR